MCNNIVEENFNISDYLIEECNLKVGRADKTALYFEDEIYSYGLVSLKVNQCANYLLSQAIKPKDKVGICLHDCPDYIFFMLGAIKCGIIPVLINPQMSKDNINFIIEDSGIKGLITSKEEGLKPEMKGHITLESIIYIEKVHSQIQEMNQRCNTASTKKNDMAFIMYTSGSSGKPKGAVHLQADVLASCKAYGGYVLHIGEKDICYSHSKLSFAYGLGNILFFPFAYGASVVLNKSSDMFSIADILEQYNPTLFFSVPTVYSAMLELQEVMELHFENVRICVAAGEALPRGIEKEWERVFHKKILQGYGSTELLHIAISNTLKKHKYGSLGMPIPGYKVSVLDGNNQVLQNGEIGELFISGDSIMREYLNNPLATRDAIFKDGLKTGDICYTDEDGFIWYAGRVKEAFKISGMWVNAAEIEQVLMMNEQVKEAIVVGESSNDDLTSIVAYMKVKNEHYKEVISNVKKLVFNKLGRELCPVKFYIVDTFKKGTTGKISRKDLKSNKVLYVIE